MQMQINKTNITVYFISVDLLFKLTQNGKKKPVCLFFLAVKTAPYLGLSITQSQEGFRSGQVNWYRYCLFKAPGKYSQSQCLL